MSLCSVELSWIRRAGGTDSILTACIHQDEVTIGAANAYSTVVTAAHMANSPGGDLVARIATNDLGCYVAMGTAADATLTDQNADRTVSSARRWVPPGGELIVPMAIGYKVAVHS